MLRLMKDGERPRPPDCGTGRASLPATMARAALRPLRAFPTGARRVFKQLLLDRQLRRAPIAETAEPLTGSFSENAGTRSHVADPTEGDGCPGRRDAPCTTSGSAMSGSRDRSLLRSAGAS